MLHIHLNARTTPVTRAEIARSEKPSSVPEGATTKSGAMAPMSLSARNSVVPKSKLAPTRARLFVAEQGVGVRGLQRGALAARSGPGAVGLAERRAVGEGVGDLPAVEAVGRRRGVTEAQQPRVVAGVHARSVAVDVLLAEQAHVGVAQQRPVPSRGSMPVRLTMPSRFSVVCGVV